jgi:hypothetical protein
MVLLEDSYLKNSSGDPKYEDDNGNPPQDQSRGT